MASSLSLSATMSSSLPSLYAPPPSHDSSMLEVIMPNVVVIPPEEEQHETPPWLYFDAADAAQSVRSTTPDIDALDTALSFHQLMDNRAPAFHRALQNESQETIVLPRKGSIAQLKENVSSLREGSRGARHRVLDEEIVEVFKVRRDEGREDIIDSKGQTMKKSKTFRARATEAFKSIKNVGKSSRRPVASASGGSSASGESARESEDGRERGTLPRPSTPNLTRRRSMVLSQLFTFSQNSRHAAAADLDEPMAPRSPPESHAAPPPRRSMQTMPSMMSLTKSHARRLHPSPSLEDCFDALSRSTSPTPTVSKRKSFRRRMSVLELQRLFSPNSPVTSASVQDTKAPEAVVDMFASSGSDPYSLNSAESEIMSSSSSSSFAFVSDGSDSSSLSDSDMQMSDRDSLEMRLDSLHFDSLHFDPDEF